MGAWAQKLPSIIFSHNWCILPHSFAFCRNIFFPSFHIWCLSYVSQQLWEVKETHINIFPKGQGNWGTEKLTSKKNPKNRKVDLTPSAARFLDSAFSSQKQYAWNKRGEYKRSIFFLQNSKDSEMWCHIEDFLRTFQVSVIIPLLTHRRYHRSSYWVDSVHFPRGMKDKKEFEKLPLTRKQLDESWREIRLISEILKIANVQSFYSIKSGFRIQGLKWNPHDQLGFNPFYPLMFYTPIVIISDT